MHGCHARAELGVALGEVGAGGGDRSDWEADGARAWQLGIGWGGASVASGKSMRSAPCPGLAETPPPMARVEMPTPGEDFEAGPPQGGRDVGRCAGIDR